MPGVSRKLVFCAVIVAKVSKSERRKLVAKCGVALISENGYEVCVNGKHIHIFKIFGKAFKEIAKGEELAFVHRYVFEDREKLVAALQRMAKPGDVILFKGSRGMRMELILEAFLNKET